MGQGTVDAALSLRPEERRQLFEEAAGVKGLQVRRNEASVRLAKSRDNLTRVSDLIAELKPQVRRLALQAEHQQQHDDARRARARAGDRVAPTSRAGALARRSGRLAARPRPPRPRWHAFRESQDAGRAASRAPRRSATGRPRRRRARPAARREATREARHPRRGPARGDRRAAARAGRDARARDGRAGRGAARARQHRRRGRRARSRPPSSARGGGRGGLARRRRRARRGGRGPARGRGGCGGAARARERPDRGRGPESEETARRDGPARARPRAERDRQLDGASRRGRARDGAARSALPPPRLARRRRAPHWPRPRRNGMRRRPRPTPRDSAPSRSPSGCARPRAELAAAEEPHDAETPTRPPPGRGRLVEPPRHDRRPRSVVGRRSRPSSAASSRERCSGPDADPRAELGDARGAARLLAGASANGDDGRAAALAAVGAERHARRLDRRRRRCAARVQPNRRGARPRRAARRLARLPPGWCAVTRRRRPGRRRAA